MVPLWMFPVAIACGNTFVLKPSEKVPLSSGAAGRTADRGGTAAGRVQHRARRPECVDALLTHPQVAAISFVGSTAIAKYIYETGTQHGKRVQAAGGAKNHLIIMPDADLDQSVKALWPRRRYGCAGQRCMAGSVAVAVGDVADPLVEGLCDHAGQFRVGPTDGARECRHGAADSRASISSAWPSYLDIADGEGARVALDGRRRLRRRRFPAGPERASIAVQPGMRVAQEEIFGPVLSVIRADGPGRGAGDRAAVPVWQRGLDLHRERLRRPRVQAALQRGHDRHQRRRAGPDGVVSVHGLEPIVLRRPAHPGDRERAFLHAAKDDAHPLVRLGGRFAPRPGLENEAVKLTFTPCSRHGFGTPHREQRVVEGDSCDKSRKNLWICGRELGGTIGLANGSAIAPAEHDKKFFPRRG